MKEFNYRFLQLKKKKTILVAPLHWGLGHATRCIPIISALLKEGFYVLIGSDGGALALLQKEFPQLPFIELPSYDISYPKKGEWFKISLFLKIPHIQRTLSSEKKIIKKLVAENQIHGIISDNRVGVRSKKVPSVFITHQINVLSGATTFFSSKVHQKIIKKFDECWVPDVEGSVNLSGKLGHPTKINFPVKYIGPLSRMKKKTEKKRYDILLLLSGPEPQRSMLEVKLLEIFLDQPEKVLLVRGVIEGSTQVLIKKNITLANFMQSQELECAINESKLVISRSGYTTIMDLAAMEKEAFFIPTPGQYEQIYLAKQLKNKGIVASCSQERFTKEQLKKVPLYSGLKAFREKIELSELFGLFECE